MRIAVLILMLLPCIGLAENGLSQKEYPQTPVFFQGGIGGVGGDQLHKATVEVHSDEYDFEDGSGMLFLDLRLGIRIKNILSIIPHATMMVASYTIQTKWSSYGLPPKEENTIIFLPGTALRYEYRIKRWALFVEGLWGWILPMSGFDRLRLSADGQGLGYSIGMRYRTIEFSWGNNKLPMKYRDGDEYGDEWKKGNFGGTTIVLRAHLGS